MREEGYYWVNFHKESSEWSIGFYQAEKERWHLAGDVYKDSDFDKIDENRIERKGESFFKKMSDSIEETKRKINDIV